MATCNSHSCNRHIHHPVSACCCIHATGVTVDDAVPTGASIMALSVLGYAFVSSQPNITMHDLSAQTSVQ